MNGQKCLLIGCGNIGAIYDYDTDAVQTHAKALKIRSQEVDFFEPNEETAKKVEAKYGYTRIAKFEEVVFQEYKMCSICTPTKYHANYLTEVLSANVPVIVCEKPIAANIEHLGKVARAYEKSSSVVIVNYVRRFQQSYVELRKLIGTFEEPLLSVSCNYYKGVLNYASHSLDIIEYLTGFKINENEIVVSNSNYDHFEDDPTITFFGSIDKVDVNFNGVLVNYPLFEVDLFFKTFRVIIEDGGNSISIFQNNKLLKRIENALENYMLPVIDLALSLNIGDRSDDNFKSSIQLNTTLLKIIQNDRI